MNIGEGPGSVASMGPRLGGRGDTDKTVLIWNRGDAVLQWGRGSVAAEMLLVD